MALLPMYSAFHVETVVAPSNTAQHSTAPREREGGARVVCIMKQGVTMTNVHCYRRSRIPYLPAPPPPLRPHSHVVPFQALLALTVSVPTYLP